MNPNDAVGVKLTDQERMVLRAGLVEWGGPARCTEELAVAMGFKGVADLFAESDRLIRLLHEDRPMSAFDWARTLLATEIVFASDVVGSGGDWVHTVGISDAETIRVLRDLQRKIPYSGVVGTAFGTRPSR